MTTFSTGNLKFKCGRCDACLTVKSMFAGKKINCPKCHKKIVVPRQGEGIAAVPEDLSPSLSKTSKSGIAPLPSRPPADRPSANSANPARKAPDVASVTDTRGRKPDADSELEKLRAENKLLKERLDKPEDTSVATAGNSSDELDRARKRIAELEQKVLQTQTESEGMRARLAAARVS